MPYRECGNDICRFRYADLESDLANAYCPLCGSSSRIIEPASSAVAILAKDNSIHKPFTIRVLLDNIRSVYNVGAIMRTSDGFQVDETLLCGITPTPANPRLSKTSLGAEQQIQWSQHRNALDICKTLKNQGCTLISLESCPESTNLYAIKREMFGNELVLMVGNEVLGIDPGLLAISDLILAIPMAGHKESFNVACAHAIALSTLYSLFLV